MTRDPGRILAAVLGAYLALSLGRMAIALREETSRSDALQAALARTQQQITELKSVQNMPDEAVRRWARTQGLVAPEDTVFFDGGTGTPETGDRLKNKGG